MILFIMGKVFFLIVASLLCFATLKEPQEMVITTFLSKDAKKIALTFDACQRGTPAYFDKKIMDYIIDNKIPATIFLAGEFAIQNETLVRQIAKKYPFIEFENHSMHHYNNMDKMTDKQVIKEIEEGQKLIFSITGYLPRFFRFPAGNYNAHDLELLDERGLKAVHWTYASGDVSKAMSGADIAMRIKKLAKPGDIIIFHVNGRGWHTGDALPDIITDLKSRGYTLVRLKDVISGRDKEIL